ncbi:MAG: D-glycerate dehydrogenase [Nitrospiraceae bacterium]
MSRPRLYISRRLPDAVMRAARERYELIREPGDDQPTRDALANGLREADAAVCLLTDKVDDELLADAPRLKILANYAVGYNNIDLASAARRHIVVSNTPDVLTDATADLTWALILAVARRVTEGDGLVRSGAWTGWAPTQLLGTDVSGGVLGIVGLGRIGQAVARRAIGVGMRVRYVARRPQPGIPQEWEPRTLGDLLPEADFLSLHVPLTAETRHVIGAKELAVMKSSAFLINTSRGPVVDESALVTALRAHTIAGAGLDVFEQEPAIDPGLRHLPQVVLLPHLGSATLATRIKMGMICLENIAAVLAGRPAPNRVGYARGS